MSRRFLDALPRSGHWGDSSTQPKERSPITPIEAIVGPMIEHKVNGAMAPYVADGYAQSVARAAELGQWLTIDAEHHSPQKLLAWLDAFRAKFGDHLRLSLWGVPDCQHPNPWSHQQYAGNLAQRRFADAGRGRGPDGEFTRRGLLDGQDVMSIARYPTPGIDWDRFETASRYWVDLAHDHGKPVVVWVSETVHGRPSGTLMGADWMSRTLDLFAGRRGIADATVAFGGFTASRQSAAVPSWWPKALEIAA